MKTQKRGSCLLLLLSITSLAIAGSDSAHPTVEVKLHDSATLSCSGNCSGLVKWFMLRNHRDSLAECDQTSCRSVKEGYQMIHDQYLNGDLSLIISGADFTKRGLYKSDCGGKVLCDVQLKIEPLNSTVQIKSGEPLVLKLEVSDPVEVIYNSTDPAGPSGQICTVQERSLQCKPEYTQRASLTSDLELRGMKTSDSGVYTVKDKKNDEVLHIYTVTVESSGGSELKGDLNTGGGAAVPVWVTVLLGVMVVVLGAVTGGAGVVIVKQKREIHQLRMKNEGNGVL